MGLAVIITDVNFSGLHMGQVTLAEDVDVTALSISGPDTVVGAESAQQYIVGYTPSNTSQRAVSWSIVSGNSFASISNTGMLTVLDGADSAAVTIRVSSQVHPNVYAEKAITVSYQAQQILPEGAIPCELIFPINSSSFILTPILPGATMAYDADVYWVKEGSGDSVLIGAWKSPVDYTPIARRGAGQMYVAYGGYSSAYDGTFPTGKGVDRYRHKVVVKNTGASIQTYSSGGDLINTQSISYDGSSVVLNEVLTIFGEKSASGISASTSFIGSAGRIKIYSDEYFETLIADYIPCFYNTNYGLWDAVTEEFLAGNTSSGILGIGQFWDTKGFIPNAGNYQPAGVAANYLSQSRGSVTSRLFDLPEGCESIQFNGGNVNGGGNIIFLDSNDLSLGVWPYNTADLTVVVPTNAAKVRLTMDAPKMGTSYIKDVTNSQYIWKGYNVE